MDREIYFFEEQRCYVVRWHGDFSHEDIVRYWRALLQDPRFESGQAALHDVRGCTIKASRSDASREAEMYRVQVEPRAGFGRAAILVDSGRTFAQAKHLLSLLELEDAIVTRSEAEAKRWIGLSPDLELPYSV